MSLASTKVKVKDPDYKLEVVKEDTKKEYAPPDVWNRKSVPASMSGDYRTASLSTTDVFGSTADIHKWDGGGGGKSPYYTNCGSVRKMRTDLMCANCGMHGHSTNQCKNPITSYGAIAYRRTPDREGGEKGVVEYIMICRKHSLGYMDFIRGKLPLTNKSYLMCMINQTTEVERARLREMCKNTYHPKEKIAALIAGVSSKAGESYTLAELIDWSDEYGCWTEPEWGFPKGKRNLYETDLNCAMREFNEETGVPILSSDPSVPLPLTIVSSVGRAMASIPRNKPRPANEKEGWTEEKGQYHVHVPLIETFTGSNGKRYCHKYELIEIDYAFSETLDMNGFQASEVSDMRWLTYDQCLAKIRKYNAEKIRLLTAVHNALQ